MNKETSSHVSTIAGSYMNFSRGELDAIRSDFDAEEKLIHDIRVLAASALSQDETPGQEPGPHKIPISNFFDRLKAEREELDRRLATLNSYLTHNPGHPNPRHAEMLTRQAKVMSEYLAILDERIADIEISRRSDTSTENDNGK